VLDTDRFITLLVMSTILWNWDGYSMARNNYRIYHDPGSDRMVFIPHGLDQMFWNPEGSIYPRFQGLLAIAVMRVPQARALYRERLASLHTRVFRVDALERRIDQLTTLIGPYRNDAARQGARLKVLIKARSNSIAQQLATDAAR
jgi:spore coat protein H